jgi:uncharacterized protein YbaP (TraB family)
MKRRRLPLRFACGILLVGLVGAIYASPTEKPFLWRIEGPVPSYLYGTVHVPDQRVLELPEVVRRAFEVSDVFTAEIPLDATTQQSMMSKVTLPPGQNFRAIVGEELFARVVRVIRKTLGNAAPPEAADLLAMTFAPMKPWAVMSQLELLEFFPDITAGRQPLDATLYAMAEKNGKELGALETLDEQIAVFDGFTREEQVRMLVSSLDDIEKPRPTGVSATQELVGLYLAGDLNRLAAEINKQYPQDELLNKKLMTRLLHQRNTNMAARIAELCARKPARSYFFAVGAMHYAGDTGIISQLTKKGLKITRLSANDASSIVKKRAA